MPEGLETVEVHLAPGEDLAGEIGAAAAALGVGLSVRSAASRPTTIGDVALPGEPERWRIEAALLRALRPRHLLFLCVANSARSQLAEGIARRLAPPGTSISSAGSEPASVRPQAVRVLAELGIDASRQRSRGIDEVEGHVDAVITLCAEEVCPVWLAPAWRLHWGLPDPAAVEGSEADRLDAFRSVRDELVERLTVLLAHR